jgi:hypothetical protein
MLAVAVMDGVVMLDALGNEKLRVLEVGSVRAERLDDGGIHSDSE